MLKVMLVALAFGAGVAGAYLVGRERHERVAPTHEATSEPPPERPPPAPGSPPSGPTLEAVLEGVRRANSQQPPAPATPEERRRQIEVQLTASDPGARKNALRALTLEDRTAARAIARQRLADPALFEDCARLLLADDVALSASDVALVRKELRTLHLDEASRTAVSMLVLETLVRLRSPAAPPFAASLLRSPSTAVRAAAPNVMVSMPEEAQVPLLLGALVDPAPAVRQAARARLAYVARQDLGDNPTAWTEWWKARSRSKTERTPRH